MNKSMFVLLVFFTTALYFMAVVNGLDNQHTSLYAILG